MKDQNNKSVAVNAILNSVKTILGVIFPLITYPYVFRVLGAEKLGVYEFSASIVSYFVLLAALGISTYGIREGTQYREDKIKMKQFVSELFSINVLSTIISFALLLLTIMIVPKFHNYFVAILLLSCEMLFATIGVSWVCNIFEDFLYITIRSVVIQILSLIFTFVFIKSSNDIYWYIAILVIANSGSNFINFFYIRKKYCKFSFTFNIDIKRHLRPILVIFSTSIAIIIYVSSDKTMLGFFTTDYDVGLYGSAVKIYSIIKTVLVSVLTVLIPRFSLLFSRGKTKEAEYTFSQIFNFLTMLILPMAVGLFMLSDDVIRLISGPEYLGASNSLRILSFAIMFSLYSFMYSQCILLPCKKESVVFMATAISATVNVLLNFILIPSWGINAAAFTTIVAEIITFTISYSYGKKIISLNNTIKNFITSLIGCVGIVVICLLSQKILLLYIRIAFSIILSVLVYFGLLYLMKNESLRMARQLIRGGKKSKS